MTESLIDAAGRRRSPATMPGFNVGRAPRNKGVRYPADPPAIEEIVAVMRAAVDTAHGCRLRALIVVSGEPGSASMRRSHSARRTSTGAVDRCSSDAARAAVGARSAWTSGAWEHLQPWLDVRLELPVGPLFCVINGPTRGRTWSSTAARADLRRTAAQAGVRRRFAPHQLRHAHAVEMAHEGVPLIVIQRQLGYSNLGITSQGRDGARCQRCRRSVSPSRPPNWTCELPRIRLSAGRAMADRDAALLGNGVSGRVVAWPVPVAVHGEGMRWPR